MRVGVDLSQKEYDDICNSKMLRLGLSKTAIEAIKKGVELTGAEAIIPCESEVNTKTSEDKASEKSSTDNTTQEGSVFFGILIFIGIIIGIVKLVGYVVNRYIKPIIEELRQGVEAQGYTLKDLFGILVFAIILSLALVCFLKILAFLDRL